MTSVRTATRETFQSLRSRNFRLFFGGQLISQVGYWLTLVAQTLLVYHLTHRGSRSAASPPHSSARCCCSGRGPDSWPTAPTSAGS
jgi:hypothetical protein